MTGWLAPLAFTAPWLLTALVLLPAIYWLLRVTPPAPRRLAFPPIRLLLGLENTEETPDRTPWWLLLLRLLVTALVILGLAGPILNPGDRLGGTGPVLLVVDDGWASAAAWPERVRAATDIVDRAGREGRPVILLTTAPPAAGTPVAASDVLTAGEARARLEALDPKPWPTDRPAALAAARATAAAGPITAIWLSDGLAGEAAQALTTLLQRAGGLTLVNPDTGPLLLRSPEGDGRALVATVIRGPADTQTEAAVTLRLLAEDGRVLDRQDALFDAGARSARTRFDLPLEARNQAAAVRIEGIAGAAATALMDERYRLRPVGVIVPETGDQVQPLLAPSFYLEQALAPFGAVTTAPLADLLDGGDQAAIALTDGPGLSEPARQRLTGWIEAGGVLIRFAGPLTAADPDPLMPVALRRGGRSLTGALSWAEPMPFDRFDPAGPFSDLTPPPEVRVSQQVLAEPSAELAGRTWARLIDGTPVVTARALGRGWLVLFHVTASPDWSDLPLSGLFVDMLRRTVALAEGVDSPAGGVALPPIVTLDGFGRLQEPGGTVRALPAETGDAVLGPRTPPGLYGTADYRQAFNLGDMVEMPAAAFDPPAGVPVRGYAVAETVALGPWLLAIALALIALDTLIALGLRGRLVPAFGKRKPVAGMAALIIVLGAAGAIEPATAQSVPQTRAEERDLLAATGTYLAYVRTGNPDVDAMSQAGLDGLARVLTARSSVEAQGAFAVDPATDELAFYPLLYWPILPRQPDLSTAAVARLNAYMRGGGTIVFDTRDQPQGGFGGRGGPRGPAAERLIDVAGSLAVPPLVPVPPDHVLTKSFYLMQEFPGRFEGGDVWVQTADVAVNDGVSMVVIGAHDWASAWAMDAAGRPLRPVVPGGDRQREMAFRFGINLVMYTLTGNYKADQVHVPSILERLGQ